MTISASTVTTVYLVRHGVRADLAASGPLQADPPLTPAGARQAGDCASYLSKKHISLLLVSPFLRTLQTGSAIALETGLPLCVEPGLSEHLCPSLFTESPNDILHNWGRLSDRLSGVPVNHEWSSLLTPQWPESEETAIRRAPELIRRLVNHLPGIQAVLVTHGGFIAACLRDLCNADFPIAVHVGGISMMTHRGGAWRLKKRSHVGHLAEPVTLPPMTFIVNQTNWPSP